MLAYRDATRICEAAQLRRDLRARLARCERDPGAVCLGQRTGLLAALLLAAEIETALEDLEHPGRAAARASSDALAAAWCSGQGWQPEHCERLARELALPAELALRRPEGYAYYALDPAGYASVAAELVARGGRAVVIGIRSIGTSLSAVVRASLFARGVETERVSVRPGGHAWDRTCTFAGEALDCVQRNERAEYIVVDEGPGLSGSTFLAVGEGLERAGVPPERISFITGHDVDVSQLVARDAARRWSRFRARAARAALPATPGLDLGGGRWRCHVFGHDAEWPACWLQAERRKYLSPDGRHLLKFVGLPPYGEAPLARGQQLAAAGFTPQLEPLGAGYLRQSWRVGRVRRRPLGSLGHGFGARLVDYLSFRSRAFPAPVSSTAGLEEMTRVNVREALELELPRGFRLELEHGVYADARLQPHEWVLGDDGVALKLDALDHGDDHHFPGPCDSAWDLAGAIVEHGLSEGAASEFLREYRRRTGDDAAPRVPAYLVAYTAERVGRLGMAALSAAPDERARLARERRFYTLRLRQLTACLSRSA